MALKNQDEYGNPTQPVGGSDEQVRAAFLKYLGHENTSNIWQNDPDWEAHIRDSDEGKQYASQQAKNNPLPAGDAPWSEAPPPAAPGGKDQWGNAVGSPQAGIDAFWNAVTNQKQTTFDPAQLKSWGITQLSPDKYRLDATGQTVDTIEDFGPGGKNIAGGWHITGGQDGQNGQGVNWKADPSGNTLYAPGGGGGGNAGSVSGTINGSTGTTPTDPMGSAVQAAIMKQLGQLQTPTDANSSTVRDIVDPYHLQSQRGLEATRRALAEQAYAGGNLNTGGYGQSQISAVEKAGADEANFTGQTVATQEAQRMAMLTSMLGLGQNSSQFSQQLSATQKNFADQLAQQDKQFAATLAANIKQFGATIGYQYALLDWSKTQKAIDGGSAGSQFN